MTHTVVECFRRYYNYNASVDMLYTAMFTIGGYICHQLPARSFAWNGMYLPLCARCTGIWAAFFLTVIICLLIPKKAILELTPKRPDIPYRISVPALVISLLFNLITFIPVFDTNCIRAFLGITIGISAGLMIFQSLHIIIRSFR